MADQYCHDFQELNALVAEFLAAYNRFHRAHPNSLREASHGERTYTPRERPQAKQVITPHVVQRQMHIPKPLTPRQQFDDMETNAIGQLELELPAMLAEGNSRSISHDESQDTKPDNAAASHKNGPLGNCVSPGRSMRLDMLISEADSHRIPRSPNLSNATVTVMHCRQFWQWCRTSPGDEVVLRAVEPIMGIFIIMNCILIAVSLDTDNWDGWPIIDWCFAALYAMEICVKFSLLGCREMYCGPGWAWSIFDATVVFLAIVDLLVQVSGAVFIFRILKLARMSRLVRLLRLPVLKELIMLIRGMVGGARCLFWCMCFISVPIFLVGILLSQVLKDWDEDGLFSSVPASMFTTFRCMCGDCTDRHGRPLFMLIARTRGWHFALGYSIFMLVIIFGVFNLITAIFIEGTMQIAKSDTTLQSHIRKADDNRFAKNLKILIYKLWIEHRYRSLGKRSPSFLSSTECPDFIRFDIQDAMHIEIDHLFYQQAVRMPHIRDVLNDMGLNDDDIIDLFDILDIDHNGTLDVNELISGLHKLRGEAKKSDLVALSYILYSVQDSIRELNDATVRMLESKRLLQEDESEILTV